MLSSALGDLREKFSHASKRIADGEVEPGRKTEADDAAMLDELDRQAQSSAITHTGHFLDEVAGVGTNNADAVQFCHRERGTGVEVP